MTSLETLSQAAERSGLLLRGGLSLSPSERHGALADVRAIALFGMIGANWSVFAGAPEYSDGAPHPLDRWSRRVIDGLADELGGFALYPFDGPPYWPFQRWAQRADSVWPSPLGLLIHADYGLWHSYRGAVAFAEDVFPAPREAASRPCDACSDKPCLAACPVGAFTGERYDLNACAEHLRSDAGGECLSQGCLARRACPVGRQYSYDEGQMRFYMRAFVESRRQ